MDSLIPVLAPGFRSQNHPSDDMSNSHCQTPCPAARTDRLAPGHRPVGSAAVLAASPIVRRSYPPESRPTANGWLTLRGHDLRSTRDGRPGFTHWADTPYESRGAHRAWLRRAGACGWRRGIWAGLDL